MNVSSMLNNIRADNKKIILAAVIFTVIAYADYSFILSAQFSKIKNTGSKISKLKSDIAGLKKDVVAMKEALASHIPKKAGVKLKRFISDQEIPSLLSAISEIANTNRVRIIQIKPLKEIKKAKEEKVVKGIPKQQAVGLSQIPLSITLDLSANYHMLGKFINELENSEVFICVEGMKISRNPEDYLHQNANLILKTYVNNK